MLVVKILPAKSSNFEGVAYNEKKIDEEKSNLLSVNNFTGLDNTATKNDYIVYLQKHSEQNKRIKKPQFHVAISTKGKDKSFDELKEFGKHYMEEMGYGSNPYLMYKHTDTENNHIHIVSSRVDNNGLKIPDNYERVRTQKIINQYYGIDRQKEIEAKLKEIDRYNVSTISQYKLLLEKDFQKITKSSFKKNKEHIKNKVVEHKDHISVFISDKKIDIKKNDINKIISTSFKTNKKGFHKARKNDIREILMDLSKKHTLEEVKLLAAKKNIDIEVFKTKDGLKNFGYTIIDRDSKSVFKGSEIMPLRNLENNHLIEKEKETFIELLSEVGSSKMTLDDINKELNKAGRELDGYGKVFNIEKKPKEHLFDIPKSLSYKFYYNTVLKDIERDYKPLTNSDSKILSYLFKVKKEDIKLPLGNDLKSALKEREELSKLYNNTLKFFVENEFDFKEQLEASKLKVYKLNNEFFIIDEKEKFIGNIQLDNDVKQKLEAEKLYIPLGNNVEFEKQTLELSSFVQMVDNLSYLFDYNDENDSKKKKKSSRNRNR